MIFPHRFTEVGDEASMQTVRSYCEKGELKKIGKTVRPDRFHLQTTDGEMHWIHVDDEKEEFLSGIAGGADDEGL